MNAESKEFWLLVFGGVFVLYAGAVLFSRWAFHSPAVPPEKLAQLRVGLTQPDVIALLGPPWRQKTFEAEPQWWYGHRLKRHVLIIWFDRHGRVRQFIHQTGSDLNLTQVP